MPLDPDRADALEAKIARLRAFDLPSLQARWKAVTGKKAALGSRRTYLQVTI
jgi:hypothetical protein